MDIVACKSNGMVSQKLHTKSAFLFIRFAACFCLIFIFFIQGDAASFYLIANAIVVVLFFDDKVLTLRNYFLAYTFLLFAVSGSSVAVYYNEVFLYYFFFLLGYFVSQKIKYNNEDVSGRRNLYAHQFYEKCLVALIILKFIFIVINISIYGVHSYFSGYLLVEKIQLYHTVSIRVAVLKIFGVMVDITSLAFIMLYVNACWLSGVKPSKKILIIFFVLLPLLALSRSDLTINLLFGLLVMVLFGKKKRVSKMALVTILFVIVVISSILGAIRQSALSDSGYNSSGSAILLARSMILSEFSGISMYRDIKNYAIQHGYTKGATIIKPLLYKIIPRSIVQNKPLNSSALVMQTYYPEQARAGFYLAPSIFGDLYLNGGIVLTIIGLFFLGVIASFCDKKIYKYSSNNNYSLIFPLIAFYLFYSIMRNNLSDILVYGLLIYFVCKFMSISRVR